VELEIVGSGGPELDGRASTSYILWIDKQAKLVVDMGSGSMLGFERSGGKLETLDVVVLTHLHIDHSVDLPSFAKAGFFSQRRDSLDIIGPSGNTYFPSIEEYLQTLFGPKGAYRYMQDILTTKSDSFQIVPLSLDSDEVMTRKYNDFTLKLISVHHGIVPALALRINIGDKDIVISGDTSNKDRALERITKNADIFIAHHAIPEHTGTFAKRLHMTPSIIGDIARDAKVKQLILTHRMNRTRRHEKESLKIIKERFKGKVIFAEDGMKIKF
jgi:ribonuclease BN (tRNA processing enzyme)